MSIAKKENPKASSLHGRDFGAIYLYYTISLSPIYYLVNQNLAVIIG